MQENAKTILHIEDDLYIRELYKEVLTEHGYIVEAAEDGEEGLSKLEKKYYDLVLLDIMLPKLNGVEVLKKIKEEGLKHGKIIVVTNIADENTRKQAFDLGADGIELIALLTPNDLVERVDGYLTGTISKEQAKQKAVEEVKKSE